VAGRVFTLFGKEVRLRASIALGWRRRGSLVDVGEWTVEVEPMSCGGEVSIGWPGKFVPFGGRVRCPQYIH
jgi:hypothetical protein